MGRPLEPITQEELNLVGLYVASSICNYMYANIMTESLYNSLKGAYTNWLVSRGRLNDHR